ncbi:hypothetical protein CRG98_017289 [Punica granatum]|uniref:MADS-box domain-containing protein n=1 Tax=Punica granatum TaxID=22663 RepID=A0A2I0K155_PUNGR|nr:hypothetical protein CRG98_017289 [Punica granatum]
MGHQMGHYHGVIGENLPLLEYSLVCTPAERHGKGYHECTLTKTELKKIEDKNAREVTFSKRKGGLLKKASELALLCGVDIVINTYSPHGNPFVYSKSSGDAIFRRFVGSTSTVGDDFNVMPLSCEDRLNEYRQQEREALSRLEEARKHQQANGNGKPRW